MKHTVEFVPSGRGKAQCDPDPDYPHGKSISPEGLNGPSCLVKLPYPAPECGLYLVKCSECRLTAAITAAGRPDDPVDVTLPCTTERKS